MITEAINVVDAVDEAIPVVRQHVQEIHDRRRPGHGVDTLAPPASTGWCSHPYSADWRPQPPT